MMRKYVFEIEPVQQQRPRATRMGRSIRMYDPIRVATYKKALHRLGTIQHKGKPFDCALDARFTFYRAIQKSTSKKRRALKISGEIVPTVKPDASNYLKAAEDALNGVIWTDDAKLVEVTAVKRYSEVPRVELEIREHGGQHESDD